MGLIKIVTKKIGKDRGTRHVGITVPENLSDILTLYNMSRGITKNAIIVKLLRSWVISLKEDGIDEDVLISELGDQLILAWKKKKANDRYASLKSFKDMLIAELEWKGYSMDVIRKILTKFNDGTK